MGSCGEIDHWEGSGDRKQIEGDWNTESPYRQCIQPEYIGGISTHSKNAHIVHIVLVLKGGESSKDEEERSCKLFHLRSDVVQRKQSRAEEQNEGSGQSRELQRQEQEFPCIFLRLLKGFLPQLMTDHHRGSITDARIDADKDEHKGVHQGNSCSFIGADLGEDIEEGDVSQCPGKMIENGGQSERKVFSGESVVLLNPEGLSSDELFLVEQLKKKKRLDQPCREGSIGSTLYTKLRKPQRSIDEHPVEESVHDECCDAVSGGFMHNPHGFQNHTEKHTPSRQKIGEGNDPHIGDSRFDDNRITGEDAEDLLCEEERHDAEEKREQRHIDKDQVKSPLHAVFVLSSEILGREDGRPADKACEGNDEKLRVLIGDANCGYSSDTKPTHHKRIHHVES